jgi:cyclohexanecarboxylate-CoA ligase
MTSPLAAVYGRAGGPWDVPALHDALSAAGPSVVDGDVRLSGPELAAEIAGVAGWLASLGVGVGDVVSWQLPNTLEAYLLYRACWRLGAVAAPVHHGAGAADLDHALKAVSPSVVLAGKGLPAEAWPGATAIRMLGRAAEPAPCAIDVASPAVVLFTSGSTGVPKGVIHTHRGLVSKARTMVATHGLTPRDVVLMPAPLAHISGLLNAVLVPGAAGMTAVLMRKWDPAAALELITAEEVSFMIGPPTFFLSLIGAPEFTSAAVASLRLVSSGGAGVTPAFVDSATAALECLVKRTYGSTEAPTVTTSGTDDPVEKARSTDGRATGEVEIRIAGTGEVQVRGPEVCEGYLDPEATRRAFDDDGWFATGDLGVLDAEGWLTITGRIKDVIIRGGENISAAEVEAALEAHPEVRQAVAVGYPDDRLGQRVCAFVVAPATFDLAASQAWLAERGVTRFKWPERVVAVESLPLLAAGKVDRAALERRAAEVTFDRRG